MNINDENMTTSGPEGHEGPADGGAESTPGEHDGGAH